LGFCCCPWQGITSHHIASHHITSHHITSYHNRKDISYQSTVSGINRNYPQLFIRHFLSAENINQNEDNDKEEISDSENENENESYTFIGGYANIEAHNDNGTLKTILLLGQQNTTATATATTATTATTASTAATTVTTATATATSNF
jgi:hypothetical protein